MFLCENEKRERVKIRDALLSPSPAIYDADGQRRGSRRGDRGRMFVRPRTLQSARV